MTKALAASPGQVRIASGVLLALALTIPVAADVPVPPTPDEVAEIQSVAFVATADQPQAGTPLPLTGGPTANRPATANRSPLRPPGDWTVLLAIAAAFALVAAFRFTSLRRAKSLPPDVFELLGEASLGGQHAVRVVRFGPRTLLIGVSASGCQTLAELDDPQATDRIASACRSASVGRIAPRGPRGRLPAKPAGGEAA